MSMTPWLTDSFTWVVAECIFCGSAVIAVFVNPPLSIALFGVAVIACVVGIACTLQEAESAGR